MNPRKLLNLLLFACMFVPAVASAVTEEDFKAKTTKNLINLCTASIEDPRYQEAIHFCHGYLVGAFHYHYAENKGPEGDPQVCFTEPYPTRNVAVAKVVSWIQQHPEYMNEIPVETEFRALTELWPCKK